MLVARGSARYSVEPQPAVRDRMRDGGHRLRDTTGGRCKSLEDKSHREEQCHGTLRVEIRDVEGGCQEILFVATLARSYQTVKRFLRFLQGKSQLTRLNVLICMVVRHCLVMVLQGKSQGASVNYVTCLHNDRVTVVGNSNAVNRHRGDVRVPNPVIESRASSVSTPRHSLLYRTLVACD